MRQRLRELSKRPSLAPLIVVALLLMTGLANLLYDAGVPAAASPVRMAPGADPFPIAAPSPALHVLEVPPTANESTRLTLLSIQGLANRGHADLYLDFSNETTNASSMLSFLSFRYGVTTDPVTLDWVYAHYLPPLDGLVVFDPQRPESVNIVTMMAGIQDAAIAGPDTAAYLHTTFGLRILFDYATSNWTSLDAAGAYDRALTELYPSSDANLLAILPPDRLLLRDYLIATRTFVFYQPQGILASPGDLASTQRLLAATPRGIPILGWFDSPTLTEENAFIQLASQYGKSVVGSEDVPDLSVLTAYGRNEVRAQAVPPAPPPLENKTYAVVAIPDGDNLDFIEHRMRTLWAEPERGTFPITWSLNPMLADLAPPYLDYFYGSATPDDRFVMGPSGAGYFYPDYLGPGDLAPLLQTTARYANLTGMDVPWLLNAFVASEIPYSSATLSAYVSALHPRGLVLDYDDQAKTQESWMQAGGTTAVPVIRSTQAWTTLDNVLAKLGAAMATWDAGPHFLWLTVYTFRFDLGDAATLVHELSNRTGGNLVVVTPEQLFSLMDEDFTARASAQLAGLQANPLAAALFGPSLAAAQAYLDTPKPLPDAGLSAYRATLASATLREVDLEAALIACGLALVLAALVDLRPLRGAAGRGTFRPSGLRALSVLVAAFGLFLFAVRAGLAANFWSYQWIILGVVLAGAGRPLRRYLDRSYPTLSLPATAVLDLVFVGLSLGTNVAFALAAVGTVAVLDAVVVRERIRPEALLVGLTLGSATGFLLPMDVLSFAVLAVLLVAPVVLMPRSVLQEPGSGAPGGLLRGFVLALPLAVLAVASNFSLGLRLGLQGLELPAMAAALLVLGPLTGLLAARRWMTAHTRRLQILGFVFAAVFGVALGFSTGTLLVALLFLGFAASFAVAAEATLRRFVAGGGSLGAAAAGAVPWIPLFLLFFRMPPVVYSLAVVHLPETVEAALYAPEYLIALAAGLLGLVAFLRARRESRVGKGYPPAPALLGGRP